MSVKIVTVGARGYATAYTVPLMEEINSNRFEYAGVVARNINVCPLCDEFKQHNIPIYRTIEDFFAERRADLVIISTPPQLHAAQSIYAMEHGAHVLCEKPIAPDYKSAKAMLEASERTGRFLAIGFQYCYSPLILSLKHDIINQRFGKARCFKSMVSWPRDWKYYGDGRGWGGKIKDADGNLLLDSVASNAAAHYLQNLLFLLGKEINTCMIPHRVQAELLRANEIENYDTCLIRMETEDNVKLMFVASHATESVINPIFDLEFEKAHITCGNNMEVQAVFNSGEIKNYGILDVVKASQKRLWDVLNAVESGEMLPCTAKTAMAHNILINTLYENGQIVSFPQDMIIKDFKKQATYVRGLTDLLTKAYETESLLSEQGYLWAHPFAYTINKKFSF